jgi:hypothetical protein
MISWLFKALEYYKRIWLEVFEKKNLWLSNIEYVLFSYLVQFWLLYKDDTMWVWVYWIPIKRVLDFIKWDFKVH